MRKFGLVAALILLVGFSTASQEKQKIRREITTKIWENVKTSQVTSRNPTENKSLEIFARYILVASGAELSDEAWNRTIRLAETPKDSFGPFNFDGLKHMVSILTITTAQKEKSLQEEIALRKEMQGKIQELHQHNLNLQQQIDLLGARITALEQKQRPSS